MISLIRYEMANLFKLSNLLRIAGIVLFLLFFLPSFVMVGYSSMVVVLFFSFVVFSFYNDTNNGLEKFKLSLPIKREDVVYSKYIFSSILMLVLIVLGFFLYHKEYFNIGLGVLILDGIVSIVTIMVIMILVFPLYFYRGFTKGSFISSIFISIMTFMMSMKYFDHYLWNISGNNFVYFKDLKGIVVLIGILAVSLLVSMALSLKLYKKREIRG